MQRENAISPFWAVDVVEAFVVVVEATLAIPDELPLPPHPAATNEIEASTTIEVSMSGRRLRMLFGSFQVCSNGSECFRR
jgi:hypothetical protein